MKFHQCSSAKKISLACARTCMRLFVLVLLGAGFSLPTLAQDLQTIRDTFGNAKIVRRLHRDLTSHGSLIGSKLALESKITLAKCRTYCNFPDRYSITDLGSLGGTESFAYSINKRGMVVGLSRIAGDTGSHPFIYLNKHMIDLFPNIETAEHINNSGVIVGGLTSGGIFVPGVYNFKTKQTKLLGTLGGATDFGRNGTALANNDQGQTVGVSYLDAVNRHAFLHTSGTIYDIGSFGGYSSATAINKQGIIAGFASNTVFGRAHAFIYAKGKMKDISPVSDPNFELSESYAHDINDKGVVVGEFFAPAQSAFHAFIYQDGKFTTFNLKESLTTVPFAINKHGKITGIMDVPYKSTCLGPDNKPVPCTKSKQHAFLYCEGRIIDLNRLIAKRSKWELTWAFDINDHGQIVGFGERNGKFRAFLLSPVSKKH